MKKRILGIVMSLLLALSVMPMGVWAQDNVQADYGVPGVDYAEGEVIAYVEGGAAALTNTGGRSRRAAPAYEVEELMTVEPSAKLAADNSAVLRSAAIAPEKSLVLVKSSQDTERLMADLENNPNVVFAEPNYYIEPYGVSEPAENSNPGYRYQWGLKNQMYPENAPAVSADVNAAEAWSSAALDNAPVVAVLDSGVDYSHPDLKDIMWSDGERYPELTAMGGGKYGYNVLATESSSDPMDTDIGHGTHCAGIIGAQWDNNEGVVGVTPEVQIMAVRFLGSTGGDTAGALRGYAYIQAAAAQGVNIVAINNSWGPGAYNGRQLRSVSTAATAIGEKYGVVSCFAAGNDNVSNDHNTGGIVDSPYVVTVGAMDSQGYKSYFSNYGQETVDVYAPGSQILSTVSTNTASLPMNEHSMPAQYLPQIQAAEDSYFYEDFEDGTNVSLRLLDENNQVVATSKALSPGYASGAGLELSMDSIADGKGFAIEIVLNRNDLKTLDTSRAFHLAFQGGFDNAMYSKVLVVQYQNEEGQWQNIDSTQVMLKDADNNPIQYMPARLRMSDHSWNQSAQEITLSDFGAYVNPEAEDEVVLRLIPEPTDDGQPTAMSGKDDNQPSTFRLDNLGFGKKASDYYYSDGTSMATPMVTGIAALISGNCETAEELCARLQGGVNRKVQEDLKDASVSGGYIDAGAALSDDSCVPVLDNLSITGNTATLTGYFFGAQGQLTVGGQAVTVTEWQADRISFTLPEGVRGKQEIRVEPAGKDYGRDLFIITPDTVGYTALAAPAVVMGESNGYPLTSADLMPLTMAATDSKIAYIGMMMEDSAIYMSVYDITTNTWESTPAPLPEDLFSPSNLTAGKSKFYLLYSALKPGTENSDTPETLVKIGTYDPEAKAWTTVDTELGGSETLVVYKDQLLAVGGEDIMEDGTTRAKDTVLIIDPATGKTTGSLPQMPDSRSGILTGIVVSASGDTLMVHGGHNGLLNPEIKMYTNTIAYDGEKWASYGDNFPNAGELDVNQTIIPAYTALNNHQMISVGPVKNLGAEHMMDTWIFDPQTSLWSGATDRLYSQTKTTQNVGAASGGKFYVLGYTGRNEEPLVFRAVDVDYTGPTGDPDAEEPAPEPSPTPGGSTVSQTVVTTQAGGAGNNASTGIFDSAVGVFATAAALVCLAAAGCTVLFKKKKS